MEKKCPPEEQKQPPEERVEPMPEQDAMEVEGGDSHHTHERARTPTPQPMDLTEIAGELQRKLQLDEDVDREDREDPYACALYVQDIYTYLHQLEVSKPMHNGYQVCSYM